MNRMHLTKIQFWTIHTVELECMLNGLPWRRLALLYFLINFTSAEDTMLFCLCVFVCMSACLVCQQDNTIGCRRILMKFLEECDVTSNNWLDFGDDPDHDADTGISKGILPLSLDSGTRRILPIIREIVDGFL